MSDTLQKTIANVVNVTIDSCVRLVLAVQADSVDELKEKIVFAIEHLKMNVKDGPVELPN